MLVERSRWIRILLADLSKLPTWHYKLPKIHDSQACCCKRRGSRIQHWALIKLQHVRLSGSARSIVMAKDFSKCIAYFILTIMVLILLTSYTASFFYNMDTDTFSKLFWTTLWCCYEQMVTNGTGIRAFCVLHLKTMHSLLLGVRMTHLALEFACNFQTSNEACAKLSYFGVPLWHS